MIRTLLIQALLFFTPFLLYWSYIAFTARKKEESGGTWDEAPFAWLVGSGIGLMLIGFAVFAYYSGEDAEGIYIPARVEDGKLIPGETITAPKSEEVE